MRVSVGWDMAVISLNSDKSYTQDRDTNGGGRTYPSSITTAKDIKQNNNSCSSIIQRIKTCVLKKTRTWMPIEEDVELKRKRMPHRDKLLRTERQADEKRTIRVTTIERETFREDHNIGGSRQRFEMPFKVTGLSKLWNRSLVGIFCKFAYEG
ncbi:hypothetical protein Tco_0019711 [Tanacetum coccineum]